ncbi:DUF3810 domain-containing protein [Sedimentibacter sp. MB31-C6]|uniref:DUF3810 domain-containing protein n=1 Tax=Sedimentibacter sp. MB31-C6 TaxID=3109366 RepID=UPI002DDD309A|nr:DUF3810 domain-containing protein [Sedimentibacter sp. MB36-C1]WSI05372.1 DUF3810 domain-containing protein [Sedimentibacter sp. MB36-C1]
MKYKRILFLILIPISLLLTQIAKYNQMFAEYYATKVYSIFSKVIGYTSSLVSISLTEIIIVILVISMISYLIITIIKTIIDKSAKYFKMFFLNIIVLTACIYFLFVLFCGINYYRYEFTAYSGLEIKPSTREELIDLCEVLKNQANDLRTMLETNEFDVADVFDNTYYETSIRAQSSFSNISNTYEILKGNYPAPKPVMLSRAMSYINITGMFFPFTFESNINVDIPPYQIPSTMCHELVHLRGFMREDEANFISYLACINSGYEDFAYSGTMLALNHSMNVLYEEDYNAYIKIYSSLSDDVKKDLSYSNLYWKQFDTKVAEISNKVNDSYLKANNQQDGVKSYGRMVDLLLAYYK